MPSPRPTTHGAWTHACTTCCRTGVGHTPTEEGRDEGSHTCMTCCRTSVGHTPGERERHKF
eukprot:267680-Chlamydomonas_euryale.AAC.2